MAIKTKMKLFKWNRGRQTTEYYVFPFIFWKWARFDMYLIKIPTHSSVPEHTDGNAKGRHFRFNIHFGNYTGGELKNEKFLANFRNIVYLFRPDKSRHSVTEIKSGNLYILSFGKIL